MADQSKGPRGRGSDPPAADLGEQRERFLKGFSKSGQLARDFYEEHEALQKRVRSLEDEARRLRAIVAADPASQALAKKMGNLENEKNELELDLAHLANLHVASNCLHSTFSARSVTHRLKEIMKQLLGAPAYSVHLCTSAGGTPALIVAEGLTPSEETALAQPGQRLQEVLQSGAASIHDDRDPSQGSAQEPAAIIPLRIEDQVVGALSLVRTRPHKARLTNIDFELFKLLGLHAASALMAAGLFTQTGRVFPSPDVFADLRR